jgi:hypothetical protein
MSINVHTIHATPARVEASSNHREATHQPIRYNREPARDYRPAQQPVRQVAPQPVRDHRAMQPARYNREPVRDHRVETRTVIDRDYGRPIVSAGWESSSYYQTQPIQLLGATALASDQLMIDTGGLGGATSLEIESAGSGSTYVSQLVAYDASGCAQVISVNAMLSPQNPMVQVALGNAANVVRIAIDGHSEWGGSIAIQAL